MMNFILKFFFGIYNYYRFKKIHIIIDFIKENCYIINIRFIQRRAIMKYLRNSKGITMIALALTIIILIILSTMITFTEKTFIVNSRFERLKNELEMVQINVDLWYEKYIDYTYAEIPIGSAIPENKKDELQRNLNEIDNEYISKDINRYRYFSVDDFENLQVDGIENEYIIDIKKRIAVLVEGYEYNDKKYYMLDDVKDVVRTRGDLDEPIRISSISLEPLIEVELNGTVTITATLTPSDVNEKIKWVLGESDTDKNLLSIEDISGKNNEKIILKANKKGRTTLTAMNERGTISTSCIINVKVQ